MLGVNTYHRDLSDAEINAGKHRDAIGGMWDEIGALQFDFMRTHGLQPTHTLIDIGCGALRGGIHFARYLNAGNYFGLDINASLIRGGEREIKAAGLTDKRPQLLVDDQFDLPRFGRTFDYGIAVSVFTHLYMNNIARCLVQMQKVMLPSSQFFCTFFEAPSPIHLAPIQHASGKVTTRHDSDPFHYAIEEVRSLAAWSGLAVDLIGDWGHPRDQRMLRFTLAN